MKSKIGTRQTQTNSAWSTRNFPLQRLREQERRAEAAPRAIFARLREITCNARTFHWGRARNACAAGASHLLSPSVLPSFLSFFLSYSCYMEGSPKWPWRSVSKSGSLQASFESQIIARGRLHSGPIGRPSSARRNNPKIGPLVEENRDQPPEFLWNKKPGPRRANSCICEEAHTHIRTYHSTRIHTRARSGYGYRIR